MGSLQYSGAFHYGRKLSGAEQICSIIRVIPRYLTTALIILLLLLMQACTTVEPVSQDEIKTRYANQSAQQAMQATSNRYEKAKEEQFDYYSPKNWKLAGDAIASAQEQVGLKQGDKEIFKYLLVADRRIDSAQYIKDRVSREFADLFETIRILQKNQAASSFQSEYQQVTAQLGSLIENFESVTLGLNSEVENIRKVNIEAQKLLISMKSLNIKVVKHNYLAKDIQRLKGISESREARRIAPVSYQQAEEALKAANEFIEKNVHDANGVAHVSNKFNFAVSHLEHVADEIIALSKTDIMKLEKVILDQENNLQDIGQALNSVDVRNLPLSMQAESIIKTATNVLEHHSEKSSMIVELSEKNVMLENRLSKQLQNDDDTSAKLKSKIKLLELDIQVLEEEREKLKEDLFALQQKNIDLAIQNAKLLADMEQRQSSFKTNERQDPVGSQDNSTKTHSFIKSVNDSKLTNKSTEREQANLQR